MQIIAPRTGTAFILKKGEQLKVTDIQGEQVSDFVCFNTITNFKSGEFKPYVCTVLHAG